MLQLCQKVKIFANFATEIINVVMQSKMMMCANEKIATAANYMSPNITCMKVSHLYFRFKFEKRFNLKPFISLFIPRHTTVSQL